MTRAYLSKPRIRTHVDFEYSQKFQTLTGVFQNQHFYLNSKNLITRSQAKSIIYKILIQLQNRGITISGVRINTLPHRNVSYTLISPTNTMVENIVNYFMIHNIQRVIF